MKCSCYRRFGKRSLDLLLAITALVVLSPLLAALAILVRLQLGKPVLFRQQRPGRGGRLFTLLKFRTMTDARDADGKVLPDAARMTRFGSFLRASSLDELPELWNVVRGEMSLVGPRPWLPRYLQLYTRQQSHRHDVRPGITGWAQVNGRNQASWDDRLQMDVWYAEKYGLWLDLKILARTVLTVLRPSDVNAVGHATMPEFEGTRLSTDRPRTVPSDALPRTSRAA